MLQATSIFNLKSMGTSALCMFLIFTSPLAQAHPPGRGWHGGGMGFYFGAPYPFFPFAYPPYPYPYVYSPPPVVITQPQSQVYIEQESNNPTNAAPAAGNSTAPAASASNNNAYWYYCEAANGYYPYVKECPAGWKQVTPTPPANTPTK